MFPVGDDNTARSTVPVVTFCTKRPRVATRGLCQGRARTTLRFGGAPLRQGASNCPAHCGMHRRRSRAVGFRYSELCAEPHRTDEDATAPLPVTRTIDVAVIVTRRAIVAPTRRIPMVASSAMRATPFAVPFAVVNLHGVSRHDRFELQQRGCPRHCQCGCRRQDRHDGCWYKSFKHGHFSFVQRLMRSDAVR